MTLLNDQNQGNLNAKGLTNLEVKTNVSTSHRFGQLEGNNLEHNSDFGFKIKINMSGKKETSTKLKEEINV